MSHLHIVRCFKFFKIPKYVGIGPDSKLSSSKMSHQHMKNNKISELMGKVRFHA